MIALSRRAMLAGSLLAVPARASLPAANDQDGALRDGLAKLEDRHGGRLGVAILHSATGRLIAHRGDEAFPLCSTFKFLAGAFVLARVDRKAESLHRRIVYTRAGLLPYSPVTGQHAGGNGLSVGALCEAAVTLSDNTAANLLLDSFGGPTKLTAYIRSLGDPVTRLDRCEPTLNEARPGDPRDTTTPAAMAEDLNRIILGTALSPASRAQLAAWLVANKTGGKRLRAGIPPGCRIGDKTGSGANSTTNDIAVVWPPGKPPIIITAYYTGARASDEELSAVLADVGRLAMTA